MKFIYTGDVPRIFPNADWYVVLEANGDQVETRPRGHVEPGDVVDAEENPHPVFFEGEAIGDAGTEVLTMPDAGVIAPTSDATESPGAKAKRSKPASAGEER